MSRAVNRTCERCGSSFQAIHKKGQYLRKNCSDACAKRFHPPAIERFWKNVEKRANGCWQWIGKSKNNWGYPKFYENKKAIMGHKWAYKYFKGAIPAGAVIMHSCDNPSCVNPEHLNLGTLQANSRDALTKGRRFGIIKLDPDKVREIRRRVAEIGSCQATYELLAPEYGVTDQAIYHIATGRTWKWVA